MSTKETRIARLKEWFSGKTLPANEKSYLSQLMKGSASFGEKAARRLEATYGMPDGYLDSVAQEADGRMVEWIEKGKGDTRSTSWTAEPRRSYAIGQIEPWSSSTPLDADDVEVPFYKEVEMAAGMGSPHSVEINGRKLRFAKSTLRAAGVSPENAACATVTGNSMERLIMDGATIGIDRGRTQVKDGKIYAIDHGGMLRVKYLYRTPGGGLRLHSENEVEHPDEMLLAEQVTQDIKILGWVFWWSQIATW